MSKTVDAKIDFTGMEPRSSYSAISLHRKCPMAWLYRYGYRLERLQETPTPYLTIGQWWGALRSAEALKRGDFAGSLKYVPATIDAEDYSWKTADSLDFMDQVLSDSEKRWKSMTNDEKEAFIGALGSTLPERLHGMYELWDTERAERHERERPLGVEVFWKRELPRPENDLAWNLLAEPETVPKMHLIGYIDELYFDRKRNMTVISDNKANKSLESNDAIGDLMDSQLQLYAWGIAPKLKRDGIAPARAVTYDRVKSEAAKEPKLTATGTLAKSVTMYDLETYKKWARQDTRPSADELQELLDDATEAGKPLSDEQVHAIKDLPAGRVWGKLGEFFASGAKKGQPKFGTIDIDPKVVEHLSSPSERQRWVRRTLDPVNMKMVQIHLRSAVDTAHDIFMTQKRAEASGQAGRNLTRMGCQMCDFQALCRAQMVGGPEGDYDYASYGLREKEPRVASE